MKNFLIVFVFVSGTFLLNAQQVAYKCYPTNWWTGMKWNKVQVMVHGDKIADNFPMIAWTASDM